MKVDKFLCGLFGGMFLMAACYLWVTHQFAIASLMTIAGTGISYAGVRYGH